MGWVRERFYTTSSGDSLNSRYSEKFIEWFRGFTEAEGSFIISRGTGNKFQFFFEISLHIDDIKVLYYIRDTLQIGEVCIRDKISQAKFIVRSQKEVKVILDIFSSNPLNSTKHLNFLAFKQAYTLYVNRDSIIIRKELKTIIDNIKNEMNSKRSNNDMPEDHKIKITPYWFLGFVEGDGSWSYSFSKNTFIFIIGQKGNMVLMNAICNYLNNLVLLKDNKNSVILYKQVDTNGSINYYVRVICLDYIRTVLIPFFDNFIWHSKKEMDYCDWKAILSIVELGLHYTDEGKNLIRRILNQMNNNRLSTKGQSVVNRADLESDIVNLLNVGSNYEVREGRTYIKSLNRYLSTNKQVAVQLINSENGNIINSFDSYAACAKYLGVGVASVNYRVRQRNKFRYQNKLVYINKIENY